MSIEEQCRVKITRAKIEMLLKNPFFGTLLMHLPVTADACISESGTDGGCFYYNPAWLSKLNNEEVASALCHSVLHCALGHPWRRSMRTAKRWDTACDYVVNLILKEEGYQLPQRALLNESFINKSAEEVYDLLPDESNCRQKSLLDDHQKWPNRSNKPGSKMANIERLWQQRTVQAAQAALKKGDLSGSLERAIGSFLRPEKDWRQLLAEFLIQIRSDYSWLPPDRRLVAYKILVPDLAGVEEIAEDLVVAVDTSGSVDNDKLQRFLSEVKGIIAAFPGIVGHLVFCDAEIQEWHELKKLPTVIPKGGGGTDSRPVFAEIKRRGLRPAALIYYTDGVSDYPAFEPAYPVLWVLTREHQTPPWGRKLILRSV